MTATTGDGNYKYGLAKSWQYDAVADMPTTKDADGDTSDMSNDSFEYQRPSPATATPAGDADKTVFSQNPNDILF
jgi:hypothetical protein